MNRRSPEVPQRRLRLIASSGDSAPPQTTPDWNAKSRQLARIRRVTRAWNRGEAPPRTNMARLAAILAFCLAITLENLAAHWLAGLRIPMLIEVASLPVAGAAAFLAVMRWSSLSRSHLDDIDRLLATYQPVSIEAYKSLQQHAQALQLLDSRMVLEWLDTEWEALAVAAGWGMPTEKRFLDRKF